MAKQKTTPITRTYKHGADIGEDIQYALALVRAKIKEAGIKVDLSRVASFGVIGGNSEAQGQHNHFTEKPEGVTIEGIISDLAWSRALGYALKQTTKKEMDAWVKTLSTEDDIKHAYADTLCLKADAARVQMAAVCSLTNHKDKTVLMQEHYAYAEKFKKTMRLIADRMRTMGLPVENDGIPYFETQTSRVEHAHDKVLVSIMKLGILNLVAILCAAKALGIIKKPQLEAYLDRMTDPEGLFDLHDEVIVSDALGPEATMIALEINQHIVLAMNMAGVISSQN